MQTEDRSRYFRTRTFHEVPEGLHRPHHLRSDTWSRLCVVQGSVALVDDVHRTRSVLYPGQSTWVAPDMEHHLESVQRPLSFYLDLYRASHDAPMDDLQVWEDEGGLTPT